MRSLRLKRFLCFILSLAIILTGIQVPSLKAKAYTQSDLDNLPYTYSEFNNGVECSGFGLRNSAITESLAVSYTNNKRKLPSSAQCTLTYNGNTTVGGTICNVYIIQAPSDFVMSDVVIYGSRGSSITKDGIKLGDNHPISLGSTELKNVTFKFNDQAFNGVGDLPQSLLVYVESNIDKDYRFNISITYRHIPYAHSYDKNYTACAKTDQEASCTEKGYRYHRCLICGEVGTSNGARFSYAALGHEPGVITVTNATCTNDGSKTTACSRCGKIYQTETLRATGHSYGRWTVDKVPTCTEEGSQYHTCKNCGNVEKDTISAYGHTSGILVHSATCTENGFESEYCTTCKEELNRTTLDALGHSYASEYAWSDDYLTCLANATCKRKDCDSIVSENATSDAVVTRQATCTETELSTFTANFSASYNGTPLFETQIVEDIATKDPLGHDISDEYMVVSNNEIAKGERYHTCSRCDNHFGIQYLVEVESGTGVSDCNIGGKQSIYLAEGEEIPTLSANAKFGYENLEWLVDGNAFTATTMPGKALVISANYSPIDCTLSFNTCGGESLSVSQSIIKFDARYGKLPTPTRQHYDFTGWYTASENGVQVEESTICQGDASLYAKWSPKKYTLSFNANGGTPLAESEKVITYNEKYGKLPTPTKKGFYFTGWYTDAVNGEEVTESTICVSDANLYAHYTDKSFKVSFDTNGGDKLTQDYKYVGVYCGYGELPTPVREDYDFVGWYTDAERGTMITDSSICESDIMLYARWQAIDYCDVVISYIRDYGKLDDKTLSDIKHKVVNSYPTIGDSSERVNKTVITGKLRKDTALSLNVIPEEDRFVKVQFNGKDASYDTKTGSVSFGNITENALVEIAFPGVSENQTGTSMSDGSYEIKDKNDEVIEYIIIKDAAVTDVNLDNETIYYFDISGNEVANISLKLSDTVEKFEDLVSIDESGNLVIGTPTCTVTEDDLAFHYWKNGEEILGSSIIISQLEGAYKLEPVYEYREIVEPIPQYTSYKIKYNLNGGMLPSKTLAKMPSSYEIKNVKLTAKPKKAGYVFLGWFIGDTKVTEIGRNVAICQGDVTVEARYYKKATTIKGATTMGLTDPNKAQITYELNGGSLSVLLPDSYANGKTIKLKTPKKEGYTFLGWFVGDTKVTSISYKSSVCSGGKNITVEAKWTPNRYTIKLDKGKGKSVGKMSNIITYYGVDTRLPMNVFTSVGREFKNWTLTEKVNGITTVRDIRNGQFVKNLTTKPNKTVTLKAFWQ